MLPETGQKASASLASTSGLLLNFKCPYHANGMKTFEQDNSAMGNQRDLMSYEFVCD